MRTLHLSHRWCVAEGGTRGARRTDFELGAESYLALSLFLPSVYLRIRLSVVQIPSFSRFIAEKAQSMLKLGYHGHSWVK